MDEIKKQISRTEILRQCIDIQRTLSALNSAYDDKIRQHLSPLEQNEFGWNIKYAMDKIKEIIERI